MPRSTRRLPGPCSLVLGAACIAGLSGCFCHDKAKLQDPTLKEQRVLGQALPGACRSHCHLVFLHGCDPLDCIDLSGMVEHLQDLGYIKTHEGEFFHAITLAEEIRQVHLKDKTARFVLIGDGEGAASAHETARILGYDHIGVDLVVYLNPSAKVGKLKPLDSVAQWVNVQGKNSTGEPVPGDHVINIIVSNVADWGLATHPQTMEIVLRELMKVASRVPVIEKVLPLNPNPEPTPKPVKPVPKGPPDEWDFLQPRSQSETLPGSKSPPPGGGPPSK